MKRTQEFSSLRISCHFFSKSTISNQVWGSMGKSKTNVKHREGFTEVPFEVSLDRWLMDLWFWYGGEYNRQWWNNWAVVHEWKGLRNEHGLWEESSGEWGVTKGELKLDHSSPCMPSWVLGFFHSGQWEATEDTGVEVMQWWSLCLIGRLLTLTVEKQWEGNYGGRKPLLEQSRWKIHMMSWMRTGQEDGMREWRPPWSQATSQGSVMFFIIKTRDIILVWVSLELDPKKNFEYSLFGRWP